MTSMTGYSYEEVTSETNLISVEIKSINSRFLDLTINLPPFLNPLEAYYRNKIQQKVVRGKVDVYIRVKEFQTDAEITVDEKLVCSYMDAFKKIAQAAQITLNSETVLNQLILQPGILNSNKSYDVEKYQSLIDPVFDKAFDKFYEDRLREGKNLLNDLTEKLSKLEECELFFKNWQPKMEELFKEQITSKFKELLGNYTDENRIMTETAAMLVKYTINEEIVRLDSHIKAMKEELLSNPIPGKKIDFICQEMNREINTIGSKNQFAEVGAMVIKAKDSLENIREQAKNVE